jgi:hypothetical protein
VPVAADEGGKNRRGHHWTARRHLAELDPPAEVGREAARRTLRKLGARTVPTCEVPVVFDPDAARSILGMLAGCVMGSSIWRKSSYLVDREGTRVASDLVTVIDDPLIPRAPGSRPFDGEGLASRRERRGREGDLRTYLCDSYSARKLGRESTASAARGGGASVGASTSNFVLQTGDRLERGDRPGTPRGLYVTEMMGFGFNAVTGRLLARRGGLLDRERRARLPRERGDDLAQRRRAVAAHRRGRQRSRFAHRHGGADHPRREDDRRGRRRVAGGSMTPGRAQDCTQGAGLHGEGARGRAGLSTRRRCSPGRRPSAFPTKAFVDKMKGAFRAKGPSAIPRKSKGAASPSKVLADPQIWELVRKLAAHKKLRDEVAKLAELPRPGRRLTTPTRPTSGPPSQKRPGCCSRRAPSLEASYRRS